MVVQLARHPTYFGICQFGGRDAAASFVTTAGPGLGTPVDVWGGMQERAGPRNGRVSCRYEQWLISTSVCLGRAGF